MNELIDFAANYWLAVRSLMWVLLACAALGLLALILDAMRGEW